MSHNLMTEHPKLFDNIGNRSEFCRMYNFLPVYDRISRPNPELKVSRNTQFFCLACYREDALERYATTGKRPRRNAENLIPTGFLFEADGIPLEAQQRNVKPQALKHVVSVTFTGNKSLHVVVPMSKEQGALINTPELYKKVWDKLATKCLFDPSVLDRKCASIGRLSRMPGATRYFEPDNEHIDLECPEGMQVCLFLNEAPVPLDLRPLIEEARAELAVEMSRIQGARINEFFASYRQEDYDAALQRLEASNVRYPSDYKQIALSALKDNDVPAEPELPAGRSHIGCTYYLRHHYPALVSEYVNRVKDAHPTNLPQPLSYYLGTSEDNDNNDNNDNN